MDLDALLGLLFFVVFVVVPLISGARKRGNGPAAPPTGKGAASPRQSGQGAPASSAQSQGTTASARRVDHPASSTLEEIRRRVQDAQERERRGAAEGPHGAREAGHAASASTGSGARGLVASDPFERGLVSGSGRSISGEPIGMGREGTPVGGQPIGTGHQGMGREGMPVGGQPIGTGRQGMGREGVSREWPPPANDMLAGREYTSVLGREGASSRVAGRPPLAGGAGRGGLGREGQPGTSVQRRSGSLGREGQAQPGLSRSTAGRSLLGREGGRTRSDRAAAAEIGVGGMQPAGTASGARLGRAPLVSTDRDGILHGLIWHEILKEAPGRKLLRRTRSRPQ